ncbi:hypothetical protein [Haloplanus salinus]|uniref:hypothetical protein n=1 Tax=Haloplanus salinus TaxID=1126245 RepID=UPI0015F0B319|nr:hypothetical protein [Haloplanus salinus]
MPVDGLRGPATSVAAVRPTDRSNTMHDTATSHRAPAVASEPRVSVDGDTTAAN